MLSDHGALQLTFCRDDLHLGPKAHHLIAQEILKDLVQGGWT